MGSLGASDVVSVGGHQAGVRSLGAMMWRHWALVGSTSLPQIGPRVGSHQGARQQWWQPCVMVVVVDSGGGSEERWGTSHIVMFMTFQPQLLDLATCRCLLLINGNYY